MDIELLDLIIPGLAAAIAAMSEFLKVLIGKNFPNWIIKNQLITIVGTLIVVVAYYVMQKPDLGELLKTSVLAFLSAGGVYGFLIKPVKEAAK